MAKGKSWAKSEADHWVERLWDSKLTSNQFVLAEQLPISARSLRAHAARRFGEVLAEWKAFCAAANSSPCPMANVSTELPALHSGPDHVANQPSRELLGVGQVVSATAAPSPALHGAIDFSNVADQVAAAPPPASRACEPFDWDALE